MKVGFISVHGDSGGIIRFRLCWSFLWWVYAPFEKSCVFLFPLAATLLVVSCSTKPPLLPCALRFVYPLCISTLFLVFAFFWLGHQSQKAKSRQRGVENKTEINKAACAARINSIDGNPSAQITGKDKQNRVIAPQPERQEERSKPESWVEYVRGSETDCNSIWFLQKKRASEFAYGDNMGSANIHETRDLNLIEITQQEHFVPVENFGRYVQKLLLKLQAGGNWKEDNAADKTHGRQEQGAAGISANVERMIKQCFCNGDLSKNEDEHFADSEDCDASSSSSAAWERSLNSSDDSRSSSSSSLAWQRGLDIADDRHDRSTTAPLRKESYRGWKADTIALISDHKNSLVAPRRSGCRSDSHRKRSSNYASALTADVDHSSSGCDSDDSVDPYVKLFAEYDSDIDQPDRGDELPEKPIGSSDYPGQCGRLLKQKTSAYHEPNLSSRISSKRCRMDRSKNVTKLSSICKAVRNFLRKIGGRKIRF